MKIVFVCSVALLLAGCGSTYKFSVDAATMTMPAGVRQQCDPIPKELSQGASMGSQTAAYNNLIALYGECATRDAAKAEWIASQGQ